MNTKQEKKLRILCERFGVEFKKENYYPGLGLPDGWVEGWVGKVYFGVSPEGEAHS